MELYKDVLYCEAYINDEYTVDDIKDMINEIEKNYNGLTDIILKKVGSYAVSLDAQMMLDKNVKAFRNFVYVADTGLKKESSLYAAKTYMEPYNTKVASTKEEAYDILKSMR